MTLSLMQKILLSNIVLTSFFLTMIFVVYYDLMRKLNNSLFQLLPGIIIFGFGIAISIIFRSPALIFKQILPIKSGFAKGILGTTVFPLVSAATRTLSIIGSLASLIDKMWFYWRKKRIFFIIRMLSVVSMIIVAGNTLFRLVLTDQRAIAKGVSRLNKIGAWSGTVLGILLFLITIMALPHIFGKKRQEQEKSPGD